MGYGTTIAAIYWSEPPNGCIPLLVPSHDGSMVLLYMVTWIPSIYLLYASIYSSTMDPSWVISSMMFLLINYGNLPFSSGISHLAIQRHRRDHFTSLACPQPSSITHVCCWHGCLWLYIVFVLTFYRCMYATHCWWLEFVDNLDSLADRQ